MKKLLVSLTAAAALACSGLVMAPAAQAAPVVSNGIAWTPNPSLPAGTAPDKPLSDYCTMGWVGYGPGGDKVGLSAAHCVAGKPDGAPIYRWTPNNGPRELIGHIGFRDEDVDWVVIRFVSNATVTANGPALRIDSIGVNNPGGNSCKDGQSTGVTCGWIISQNATRIYTFGAAGPGDSGGPLAQGNSIIGLTRGVTLQGFEYIKIAPVLRSLNFTTAG